MQEFFNPFPALVGAALMITIAVGLLLGWIPLILAGHPVLAIASVLAFLLAFIEIPFRRSRARLPS